MHFGSLWCIVENLPSPWPLHILLWLHLIQRWIFVTYSNLKHIILSCYSNHFSVFLCIWCNLIHKCTLGAIPWLLHQVLWLPFLLSVHLLYNGSHRSIRQIQNTFLCHGTVTIWCLFYYFAALYAQPHNPSMSCSDFCPTSRAHLIRR